MTRDTTSRLLDRANAAGRPAPAPTPARAFGPCPSCGRRRLAVEVRGPRAWLIPEHLTLAGVFGDRRPCPAAGDAMPAVIVYLR